MLVTKLDGTVEPFAPEKLVSSLERSGATPTVAREILSHIEKEITDGASTSHIYKHARRLLRTHVSPHAAARYSLRRAVLDLGPSGFPFERLLGEIFKKKGYAVTVGQMLQGKCVEHEVDVVAKNDSELILVEAKFHNALGFKTDVKVALYIHARFLDIQAANFCGLCPAGGTCRSWLVTNTKFTEHAITYGKCVGITMVGWGYPRQGNVQDLIEEAGLHPLSCLTTLTKKEREALYAQGMVLCRNVTENPNILQSAGVSGRKVEQVLSEAYHLCTPFQK